MKEDREELELTSGDREFHKRHDEGMKEERYRETVFASIFLQTLECGRRDREVLGCSRVSRSR